MNRKIPNNLLYVNRKLAELIANKAELAAQVVTK